MLVLFFSVDASDIRILSSTSILLVHPRAFSIKTSFFKITISLASEADFPTIAELITTLWLEQLERPVSLESPILRPSPKGSFSSRRSVDGCSVEGARERRGEGRKGRVGGRYHHDTMMSDTPLYQKE